MVFWSAFGEDGLRKFILQLQDDHGHLSLISSAPMCSVRHESDVPNQRYGSTKAMFGKKDTFIRHPSRTAAVQTRNIFL